MTAATLTLAEFLLARIAEDEAERVTRPRKGYLPTPREVREADRWEAECQAKRRIVENWQAMKSEAADWHERYRLTGQVDMLNAAQQYDGHAAGIARWALLPLALPYVDHPDYLDVRHP